MNTRSVNGVRASVCHLHAVDASRRFGAKSTVAKMWRTAEQALADGKSGTDAVETVLVLAFKWGRKLTPSRDFAHVPPNVVLIDWVCNRLPVTELQVVLERNANPALAALKKLRQTLKPARTPSEDILREARDEVDRD